MKQKMILTVCLTVLGMLSVKAQQSIDDKLNTPFTDDSLRTAGYLGNDGTVVGITGGTIPYTP